MQKIYPICVPFKRHHELEGQTKEYDIKFRNDDSTLDKLIDFISLPFVERVNITFIGDDIPTQIIKTANKVKDCIYVRLMPDQTIYMNKLKDENIRFFFDSTFAPENICQLQEFVEDFGVTDVYIVDDLTYNLGEVADYCAKHDVQLRVVLNAIPMTTLNKGSDARSPIYRPQDTEALTAYYDVFEFDCGDPYDWHLFNVLFKRYFITHDWLGDLNTLNNEVNFENGFPNDCFLPEFTLGKLNCGRRCIRNSCRKCQQFYDLGLIFAEKGVRFKED